MTLPQKVRIMLDLETLDTKPTAVLVSIGAVVFDPHRGLGGEFYQAVKQDPQPGRTISERTVQWWSEQSADARAVLSDPKALVLDFALLKFASFCREASREADIEMWGNGADFDCVILGSAYEGLGIPKPWSYSSNRCFRTLKNLGLRPDTSNVRMTHHNALDDAKYQARDAISYLRQIGVMA
jgi:hypothetical protein